MTGSCYLNQGLASASQVLGLQVFTTMTNYFNFIPFSFVLFRFLAELHSAQAGLKLRAVVLPWPSSSEMTDSLRPALASICLFADFFFPLFAFLLILEQELWISLCILGSSETNLLFVLFLKIVLIHTHTTSLGVPFFVTIEAVPSLPELLSR